MTTPFPSQSQRAETKAGDFRCLLESPLCHTTCLLHAATGRLSPVPITRMSLTDTHSSEQLCGPAREAEEWADVLSRAMLRVVCSCVHRPYVLTVRLAWPTLRPSYPITNPPLAAEQNKRPRVSQTAELYSKVKGSTASSAEWPRFS